MLFCAAASFTTFKFPDAETMSAIIEVHFPEIKKRLVAEALRRSTKSATCPA